MCKLYTTLPGLSSQVFSFDRLFILPHELINTCAPEEPRGGRAAADTWRREALSTWWHDTTGWRRCRGKGGKFTVFLQVNIYYLGYYNYQLVMPLYSSLLFFLGLWACDRRYRCDRMLLARLRAVGLAVLKFHTSRAPVRAGRPLDVLSCEYSFNLIIWVAVLIIASHCFLWVWGASEHLYGCVGSQHCIPEPVL